MATRRPRPYPHAARNLDDAYWNLDPDALEGPNLDRFYVERPDHSDRDALLEALRRGVRQADKLRELTESASPGDRQALRIEREPGKGRIKCLVLGHLGCGKSTELNWLARAIEADSELQSKLLVVRYPIGDLMDTLDLEFVDIAMSMVLRLYEVLEELSIAFDHAPLEQIYRWLEEESWERAKTAGIDLDFRVALANLIGVGVSGKGELKNVYRGKILKLLREFLELVNEEIIARLEDRTGTYLLFIIDDLDKVGPQDRALRIFRDNRLNLIALNCFAVYTAPISLALEPDFMVISERFEPPYFVPMFRVHDMDWKQGPEEEPDIRTLCEIVYRRAAPELFDKGVVNTAIQMTGGALRQLMEVLQECCLRQIRAGGRRITAETLERVKQRWKDKYWRMLTRTDYENLSRITQSKERADVDPRYLQSLCVLEYSPRWCDVHPLVRELLAEWEKRTEAGA